MTMPSQEKGKRGFGPRLPQKWTIAPLIPYSKEACLKHYRVVSCASIRNHGSLSSMKNAASLGSQMWASSICPTAAFVLTVPKVWKQRWQMESMDLSALKRWVNLGVYLDRLSGEGGRQRITGPTKIARRNGGCLGGRSEVNEITNWCQRNRGRLKTELVHLLVRKEARSDSRQPRRRVTLRM